MTDEPAIAGVTLPGPGVGGRPTFDAQRHRPREGGLGGLVARIFGSHWFWWLVRTVWPIPRVSGWALVSRYDDVAEGFSRHDAFRVPFDAEITRLNGGRPGGTPFILGIDAEAEHERQLKLVMHAFRHEDLPEVEKIARDAAREQLKSRASDGKIDAIADLITAVPVLICERYYGVAIAEPQTFAYATIAVSSHLFGVPPIKDDSPAANDGAAYVGAIVDAAVDAALEREKAQSNGDDQTVIRRLVSRHVRDPQELPRAEIRAFLIGMITGFVPTNTLAGGNILDVLCRRPKIMQKVKEAAKTGDDALLMRHLFEALRFMPINPGRFRLCDDDHHVGGDSWRAARIRKGTTVLASTQSAMFDSRRIDSPWRFNEDRDASDYMHFGYGLHWCAGVHIARAQITQTFKALLSHGEFKCAGSMRRRGTFPDHLTLRFGPRP